ncbi:MAG: hypothetical protein EBT03_08820, partial [Betaproteobacteria bacterium]|nr:hypothetical protein [Betaproteobacteria bacterium]
MAQAPTYNDYWGLFPSLAALNAATLGNPALNAGDAAVVGSTDYQFDGVAWQAVTPEVAAAPALGTAVNTQSSVGSAQLSSDTGTGETAVVLANTASGYSAQLSANAVRPKLSSAFAGSPAPFELDISELVVGGSSGSAGEMLTSNGPTLTPTWQAAATGTIAGTIAANEVAFGTAPDTIGGDAGFTFDGNTLEINSGGAYSLRAFGQVGINDIGSGEEIIEFEPSLFSFNVRTDTTLDPGPGYITTVSAGQVAITQNTDSTGTAAMAGTNVDPAKVTLSEIVPGTQTPTIQTDDGLGNPLPLDVVINELRLNGAPGAAGEVLTSNGAGVAPTWQASSGGINELTGDVTAGPGTGSQAATLAAIRGNAVANVAPTSGQVLTWNGTAWVPAPAPIGGSGAGIPYYLNHNTAAGAPTAGITNPATTTVKQLGTTADVPGTSVTSGLLSQVSYDLVANFVSDVGSPNKTSIPAGLWTFNVWASSNATQASQTILQIQVGKYDGVNPPTIIATSNDVSIYDPSVTAQYIINVVIPAGTTLLATDRLYVAVRAKATAANRTVTVNFGDGFPSYVVSTFQAASGTVSTAQTDNYYVDAVLGDDLTADNPTSKQEACRKITVNIDQARSSQPGLIASQANDFNGIYEENLWVPSRMITFVGPGVKIGNNADNTGFGNITQEISTARRFGATSSEVRHTLSYIGRANSRDTHQRVRNGIHVGGITRVSCIARNIGTIQGDSVGGTRVTITLAGGQNPYGVPVSPYASLAVTLTDAGDVIGYTSPTGVAIANS